MHSGSLMVNLTGHKSTLTAEMSSFRFDFETTEAEADVVRFPLNIMALYSSRMQA